MSDIDTVVVDSLKALDPERPIREADIVDAVLALPICANPGSGITALNELPREISSRSRRPRGALQEASSEARNAIPVHLRGYAVKM